MNVKNVGRILSILILLLGHQSLATEGIEGKWVGAYRLNQEEQIIEVNFETKGGEWTGTLDKPRQDVRNLSLSHVEYNEPRLQFSLLEEYQTLVFVGEMKNERIYGTVKGDDEIVKFYLYRVFDINRDLCQTYTGTYEVSEQETLVVELNAPDESPVLAYKEAGQTIGLYALTSTTFFSQKGEIIVFGKNRDGEVIGLVSRKEGQPERPATRLES